MTEIDAIRSQIKKYTTSLIKMEYKLRRLEENPNPPEATLIAYRRIMEIDAVNRRRLIEQMERL